MQRQPHWRIIIAAVVILTLVSYLLLLAINDAFSERLFWLSVKLVSGASLAIYLLWLAFDKWLWRVIGRLPIDTWPDLNGKWKGTGQITVLPHGNDPPPPVDLNVDIEIIQTYTSLWVNYRSTVKDKPEELSLSHARAVLVQPTEKSPYSLEYHFVTEVPSFKPGTHGLAVLTLTPGSGSSRPELRGEWVSDTKVPIAGTVSVTKVA